jgi:hypothetical protein
MENAINFSVTPLQALLAVAFQVWIIAFPIILIRKVNYLTGLIEEKFGTNEESNQQS